jgi:hypothetical protein
MALAFKAYHDRDWVKLRELLGTVQHPQWLNAQNSAYYTLLSGVETYKRGDIARARQLLADTSVAHLRTDNMRSILECHRAEVALAAHDRFAAQLHLARAREIPHSADVDGAVAELERQLANGP